MITESFTVTAEIAYRPYRIPPRCRKERPVNEVVTHPHFHPAVTSADAPVVAIVPDDRGYLGTVRGGDVEMRHYDGRLYVALTDENNPVTAGSPGSRVRSGAPTSTGTPGMTSSMYSSTLSPESRLWAASWPGS
jgi:hypothetical protein